MAFSAALRRAASSTAIRALGWSHRSHHTAPLHSLPALSRRPLSPRAAAPLFPPAPRFSSQVKIADLVRVIDSEIKCAEECDDHDRVEENPDSWPFEIHDEKGSNVITLKRSFRDEKIEVIVQMPSLVTGDGVATDGAGGDGDDHVNSPNQSSLPIIIVNVTKGDGLGLEFTCTAYADEVAIDGMSVKETKGSDEEMFAYEGPDFNDLDENLQKAFHKYLEIRGISALTTNFLHEYMINKDKYLIWLKDVKRYEMRISDEHARNQKADGKQQGCWQDLFNCLNSVKEEVVQP